MGLVAGIVDSLVEGLSVINVEMNNIEEVNVVYFLGSRCAIPTHLPCSIDSRRPGLFSDSVISPLLG